MLLYCYAMPPAVRKGHRNCTSSGICVCVCLCLQTCVRVCVFACVHLRVCVRACACTCVHLYMCVCLWKCMCVCECVYVCACVRVQPSGQRAPDTMWLTTLVSTPVRAARGHSLCIP